MYNFHFINLDLYLLIIRCFITRVGRYSIHLWVRVCHWDSETLQLQLKLTLQHYMCFRWHIPNLPQTQ